MSLPKHYEPALKMSYKYSTLQILYKYGNAGYAAEDKWSRTLESLKAPLQY